MFTRTQKKMMVTLGIVSDKEQYDFYEAYCEVSCEMRANGMGASSFTSWLEHKLRVAEYLAKRKMEKALAA